MNNRLIGISQHFINLSVNKAGGLPEYARLEESVYNANSKEEIYYLNLLYYAIKDLFSIIESVFCEIVKVNEIDCSIDVKTVRIITNKVGVDTQIINKKIDKEDFEYLYLGKSIQELNKNPVSFSISKLDKYSGDNGDPIFRFTNEKRINENLEKLFEPIIDKKISNRDFESFVKLVKELPEFQDKEIDKGHVELTKIPAKFYALYHWILIEMGIEIPFAKNENDQFIRREIEAYAETKYPECPSQGFYRSFINLDIKNRIAIANSFGKGYKEILISISNNNNKIITHLKDYPN